VRLIESHSNNHRRVLAQRARRGDIRAFSGAEDISDDLRERSASRVKTRARAHAASAHVVRISKASRRD
jgi:hypothetical protein